MKTQSKHAYVRCEVNVTEFNVERGFATTGGGASAVGAFANAHNAWTMTKEDGQEDFQNEKFAVQNDIQWFE